MKTQFHVGRALPAASFRTERTIPSSKNLVGQTFLPAMGLVNNGRQECLPHHRQEFPPHHQAVRSFFLLAGVVLILYLLLSLLLSSTAHGAGLLISDTGGLLDIEEHTAAVTIDNGIAVTKVTQVFRNNEDRTVEALYTFPVPANASVAGFTMWINGKEMIGEVVEKQAAREIYNAYKAANRDPGLLEQSDYRTFDLRIFPIPAHAQQKVQVTYYQELDSDGDWTTYVYPLASNVRQVVNSRVSKSFSLTVDVKSAIPITVMKSPSHPKDMSVVHYAPGYSHANLTTSSGGLDRDIVLAYQVQKPETGAKLVASTPNGADGYFCMMLMAGEDLKPVKTPMDYAFLLDVSGSMRDDDKIGQSRGALGAFIDILSPDDRFDCLAFNASLADAFGGMAPADEQHKNSAHEFLTSRRVRGGTDMNAALAAAYRLAQPGRTLNVVVISDGLTEQSELPALVRVVNRRPQNCRILCVGVGNDVDRALLQKMADSTGGLAAFVSNGDDFHRQATAFARKLQRPALSDVKIEISGVHTHDIEMPVGRNLYDGVPIRVYGRYSAGGPGNVTLAGTLDGKPYSHTFAVDFPEQADANPEIERMWASRRIVRLMNRPGGTSSSDIDQIVRLGEAYSISTEYTSFIVLENDAEYERWKIAQRNALRLTNDRDAEAQLESELKLLRAKTPGGLGDPSASPAADATPTASPATSTPITVSRPTPAPTPSLSSPSVMSSVHAGGAFDWIYAILTTIVAGFAIDSWYSRKSV